MEPFLLNIENMNGNKQNIMNLRLLCNTNNTLENVNISKNIYLGRNLNINYRFIDENVDFLIL